MKVSKKLAIKLFRSLGYHTAHTWTLDRLQSRINRLVDVIDPDADRSNLSEKLSDLLTACLSNAGSIEVIETSEQVEDQEDKEQPQEIRKEQVMSETPAQPKSRSNSVSAHITELMKQGIWDKKEIAKRLNVHVRRVHVHFHNLIKRGKLVKEGESYRFVE